VIASDKPDISDLKNCIEDAKTSILDDDIGPELPTDYHQDPINELNDLKGKGYLKPEIELLEVKKVDP
jgi:hypothetical protein